MLNVMYSRSAYRHIPNACIIAPPKNRGNRRRWPMIVLSFILGLLAGWAIRGGGAWLP